MPSYTQYMRQISVLDSNDEDITWITVKGNHIPIKKGQSKRDAVKEFFESKKSGGSKSEEDTGNHLTDSSGKRIKNPEKFAEWFKDSKIVKGGKPMPMFHSTDKFFDEFKIQDGGGNEKGGWGFYFKSNPGYYFNADKEHQIEVYLSVQKPWVIDYKKSELTFTNEQMRALSKKIPNETYRQTFQDYQDDKRFENDSDVLELLSDAFGDSVESKKRYFSALREVLNIDGIKINGMAGDNVWVIAFDPKQIQIIQGGKNG